MKRQRNPLQDGKTQSTMTGKLIRFRIYSITGLGFVSIITFFIYVDRVLKDEHVPDHVFFLGESLGGMKQEVAIRRIRDIAATINSRPLHIHYGEQIWRLSPETMMDFRMEQEGVVERLRRIGNEGNTLARIRERLRLHTGREQIELEARFFYNKEKVHRIAELLALGINRPAESARIVEEKPFKRLLREKNGVEVSSRELSRQLIRAMAEVEAYRSAWWSLETVERKADVDFSSKVEQLSCREIARVTMPLPRNHERQARIKRAAELLDGLILTGSDRFSLQELLSTSPFPPLKDEEWTLGYFPDASGLGPLATALYQGAVLAGMDILERHHHRHLDLQHRYTEPGRDAAIDFKTKDLKFRNRRQTNSILELRVESGELRLRIHASEALPGTIDFVSRNYQVVDCPENVFLDGSLPRGQREVIRPGLAGIKIDMDRRIQVNDKEDLLPLSHSSYEAIPRDVRVGDKKP